MDWVINGEDADKDGYGGDYDCNDTNPNAWQNVLAYVEPDGERNPIYCDSMTATERHT